MFFFFFSSRRRHTRCSRDWSSDVCSSDLHPGHRARSPAAPAASFRAPKRPSTEPRSALDGGGTVRWNPLKCRGFFALWTGRAREMASCDLKPWKNGVFVFSVAWTVLLLKARYGRSIVDGMELAMFYNL